MGKFTREQVRQLRQQPQHPNPAGRLPDPPPPQMNQHALLFFNMILAAIAKKSGGEYQITKQEMEACLPSDLKVEDRDGILCLRYIPNKVRLENELAEMDRKRAAIVEALAMENQPNEPEPQPEQAETVA